MKGCLDPSVVEIEKKFTVDDIRRALDSCARAAKPREHMVVHSLRRAMCLMSQSLSSIIVLRPLIRALSLRDSEAAKIASGLLLILEFSPPQTMSWSEKLHVRPSNKSESRGEQLERSRSDRSDTMDSHGSGGNGGSGGSGGGIIGEFKRERATSV